MTATDNGGLAPAGQERSELITSLRPQVAYTRRSPGLRVDLEAAATLVGYANGTQRNAILPDLRASLSSELVERLLFIDAGASAMQSPADPFGPRPGDLTTANRRTETSFRVSPYILRDLSPSSFILARHDAATTGNGADSGARLVSNRSIVRYEHRPVPYGVALELSRLDNESSGSSDSNLTIDTARVRGSVALRNEMILGVVAGADHSRFTGSDHTDALYGILAEWNPGPRTALSASLEHRFFGRAGVLQLSHRTPFMSFAVSMSREPVAVSSSLGELSRGSDLRPFLDAILTTRYPDPNARSGVVQSLVGSRGLDTRLPGPIDLVAGYPQIQTGANATWVLLGTRNTASVTLYTQTLRRLDREGESAASTPLTSDNRQVGASIQVGRRLSTQTSADAVLQWSRITGLADRTADVSEERIQRFSVTRNLSPRTGVSAGVQHTGFATNAAGQHPYRATLLFVGMSHRF